MFSSEMQSYSAHSLSTCPTPQRMSSLHLARPFLNQVPSITQALRQSAWMPTCFLLLTTQGSHPHSKPQGLCVHPRMPPPMLVCTQFASVRLLNCSIKSQGLVGSARSSISQLASTYCGLSSRLPCWVAVFSFLALTPVWGESGNPLSIIRYARRGHRETV